MVNLSFLNNHSEHDHQLCLLVSRLSGALTFSDGLNLLSCTVPGIAYLWGRNVCFSGNLNVLWLAQV